MLSVITDSSSLPASLHKASSCRSIINLTYFKSVPNSYTGNTCAVQQCNECNPVAPKINAAFVKEMLVQARSATQRPCVI